MKTKRNTAPEYSYGNFLLDLSDQFFTAMFDLRYETFMDDDTSQALYGFGYI